MVNKNNFLRNFWKKEWFSFSLTILSLFSSYAFYQIFPDNLNIIAFLFPFIILATYLYFLLFFKIGISLYDYYKLRDISVGFLTMIYFSLSLYIISYPINIEFWWLLFLGFFLIYISSLFLKYFKNKLLAKIIALFSLIIILFSIFFLF
jgi:hypothetical protein